MYDRRLDRLASLLPRLAEKLGCRRRDHELRARVEAVAGDLEDREAILEHRRKLVREENNETA